MRKSTFLVVMAAMFAIAGFAAANDPPTDWKDSVSRAPMWKIDAFTGLRSDPTNPNALVSWWRDDNPKAVENMIDRIMDGYNRGARRFFINRPMGTNGRTHVPAASWLTIDAAKRAELADRLVEMMTSGEIEPIEIHWFVGSEIIDPRDMNGWRGNDDETYLLGDTSTHEGLIATRNIIGGWLSTGAAGLVIDHSSPPDERGNFIRLNESMNGHPFDFTIMGEAFPIEFDSDGVAIRDENGSPLLDEKAMQSMGWVGTDTYIRHESRWPVGTVNETWPPNPDVTRMFCWFNHSPGHYGSEADQRDLIKITIRDGLIPITNSPVMFNYALQIYHLMQDGGSVDDPEPERDRLRVRSEARERRVAFANPAPLEFQEMFVGEIEAQGLLDRAEFILQVNSKFQGSRDSFPDRIDLDDVDTLVLAERQLERQFTPPKPYLGLFWDYEPRYTRDNGTTHSWGWPPHYDQASVDLFNLAATQFDPLEIPVSIYGHPWLNRIRPTSNQELSTIGQMRAILDSVDWVQLNLYPHPNHHAEISEQEEKALRARIHQNIVILEALYPGKPIVPFFFPRYGRIDNARMFQIYLQELDKYPQIDTICIWLNTHSDLMYRVYTEKFNEVAPFVRLWLDGEISESE